MFGLPICEGLCRESALRGIADLGRLRLEGLDMTKKTTAANRREALRKEYWPNDEDFWTGENEKGWFPSPRTLPLLLVLLSNKQISDKKDPSKVYLELFSRHLGEGIIEMASEADHAYAAGYVGTRAVRTWKERMEILERHGFIKTKQLGNQRYKIVAIVHPTTVIESLREKLPNNWLNAYIARKAETKEHTHAQRQKLKDDEKRVVQMAASTKATETK